MDGLIRGGFDGVGFVFSSADPFFGIDLDACRNPQTGELTAWAQEIVDSFASYTEVSPSGYGVKLVARGKLPQGSRNVHKPKDVPTFGDKAPEIAIHDERKYWCLTGQRLPDAPSTCEPRQEQLDALLGQLFPSKKSAPTNGSTKAGGSTFERLLADCAAAVDGQRSERDFALLAHAVRRGMDRNQVQARVQSIGKFAEAGERYFELTWQRAEQAAAADSRHGNSATVLVEDPQTANLLSPAGWTDLANARRFCLMHGDDVRWCEPWSKWLVWSGMHWALDAERKAEALAKQTAKAIWHKVAALSDMAGEMLRDLTRFAKYTSGAHGIGNMLAMVKSDLAILPSSLDVAPWSLNCPNGTLDLRTGELRPHRREDYLTKLCTVEYDPIAKAPHWEAMLDTIMDKHADLITFLQRSVGYSLTGSVAEQVLFLLWGKGANGKSTFLNALLETLGRDYAMQAPDGLLMAKQSDAHPTERADLFGKRFVSSVEVEEGRRLAESLVKQLTGGDAIRARRMREDHWEFRPTHKLWMAANHKPTIWGTDHGIWRRVKLIPFVVTIADADQDKELPAKLAAERAGILAWSVRGCLDWQLAGLGEPDEVKAATAEYRAEMDVLGAFLADCCIESPKFKAKASTVYAAYVGWCKTNGEYAVNQRRFGLAVTERGIERYTSNGIWYRGLGLAAEGTEGTERVS
jgi:putative DNA primase/helicase